MPKFGNERKREAREMVPYSKENLEGCQCYRKKKDVTKEKLRGSC